LGDWNWQVFLQDTGGGQTYLQWLMSAWGWTLSVALLALVIALVVGSVIGVLRTLPNRAPALFGEAWTELFRNVPLLVQLFVWYHVLPAIFLSLRSVPSFLLVVFGLGVFT
jgi:glutamate/aspartate transport system permease protein